MIHLKIFNKKQLAEFVSSGEFKKYDFLPITEHRAKSQIRNPKANDEQTLLILAFEEEKLAGYIGCFPDNFKINGRIYGYAWLSTIFVSNEFRGRKIAQTLLNKAFEEYHGNIALTEFTKEAESLYNKTGVFEYIQPKKGKRYYFHSDLSNIIPAKKPGTKFLKPFFQFIDFTANTFISIKNNFAGKAGIHVHILHKIDAESAEFISGFKSNRISDEINWIIENPWVLEGKKADENYLFSSFSEIFRYYWVKIYDENKTLITCSLLLLRDGHLKIPYLFSDRDLGKFTDFLGNFIREKKIKTLTSYQTELNEKIRSSKSFPKLHERDFERRYMFHQELIRHLPKNFNPDFQDGDGDCSMT